MSSGAQHKPPVVNLTIDGEPVSALADATILETAWSNCVGEIPALCHKPTIKPPVGVCRVCVVDVGERAYAAACVRTVQEGMKVKTKTPEIVEARRILLQLLMADHPQTYPQQSGAALEADICHSCLDQHNHDCELETLVANSHVAEGFFSPLGLHSPAERFDLSSHSLRVDYAACILCDRCVRACAEENHHIIARHGKGYNAGIAFGMGEPMYSSGCVSCGACAIACPTGAITSNFTASLTVAEYESQKEKLAERGELCSKDDLLKFAIFKHVSEKFLEQNLDCVVRRQIEPNQLLFEHRKRAETAFYLIEDEQKKGLEYEQKVKVLTKHPVEFGAGELIGDMSCMNSYPHVADAKAVTHCDVLEMLRNMVDMARNSMVRGEFEKRYGHRALKFHLRANNSEEFASLSDEFISSLEKRITLVRYGPKEIIFRAGEKPDAFYLIWVGFVRVSYKYHGGDFVIKYLPPGSYFGEMSLLEGKEHAYTCSALHHVELLRIEAPDFQLMLNDFGDIRNKLEAKAAQHRDDNEKLRSHFADHYVEKVELGLEEAESMLVLDLDKCTRCDQCVIACQKTHDGITRLIRDGKRVDHYLVASACRHCHDPLCMICHWNAISRDDHNESRAVIIHQDKCVGCGQCALHCPYGNIKLFDSEGKLVPFDTLEDPSKRNDQKAWATSCDLCHEYQTPNCVLACPHDAAYRDTAAQFRKRRDDDNHKPSLQEFLKRGWSHFLKWS